MCCAYYSQKEQYANESVLAESAIENMQIYVYRPHRDCTALSAQIVLSAIKNDKKSYSISVYGPNQKLITAENMGFSSVSVDALILLRTHYHLQKKEYICSLPS